MTLGVDICRNSPYMEEHRQLRSDIAYWMPGTVMVITSPPILVVDYLSCNQ